MVFLRMLVYHKTVKSALQGVGLLVRTSPAIAVITAPVEKAEVVALRQVKRHSSITASRQVRSALRAAGYAAVQLVVMPPKEGEVAMFLLSNIPPAGSREDWQDAFDPDIPLTWRNYELFRGSVIPKDRETLSEIIQGARGPGETPRANSGAVTWRLKRAVRKHYRTRLARLITGRGGWPDAGQAPQQLSDETARTQVLLLAEHLGHYPGLRGIRADVFSLAQYSTRVWKSTRRDPHYPVWSTMPYSQFSSPQTAPLSELTTHLEEGADAEEEFVEDHD